jgi:hypothetical protein
MIKKALFREKSRIKNIIDESDIFLLINLYSLFYTDLVFRSLRLSSATPLSQVG